MPRRGKIGISWEEQLKKWENWGRNEAERLTIEAELSNFTVIKKSFCSIKINNKASREVRRNQ